MLRFLMETWLPTVVFGAFGLLFAAADRDAGCIRYAAGVAPWVVVPLIWKSFVIRQGRPRIGRAALAGSASAFVILWADAAIDSVRQFIRSGQHGSEELGGLLIIFVPFTMLIGFLLGAGVASLIAFLQAHSWPPRDEGHARTDLALDGLLGGALVATVFAPSVAFFAAIFFGSLINARAPGMTFFVLLAGAWLTLVPAAACLGVLGRWKEIHASFDSARDGLEPDRS